MEETVKDLLRKLTRGNYIGAKHTPEKKLILKATRNAGDKRAFMRDYRLIQVYLIREKKRTKKGSDWHISINPKHLKEVMDLIGEKDGR